MTIAAFKRAKLGIMFVVATTALACLLRWQSSTAGWEMKPESAKLYDVAARWMTLVGLIACTVAGRRKLARKERPVLFLLVGVCLCPWFFPDFREFSAWNRFKDRAVQEMNPSDIARWINSVAATNNLQFDERDLRPDELRTLIRSNSDLPSPRLMVFSKQPAIMWGSDIQMWGITEAYGIGNREPWTNGLFFVSLEK
jgi:hypothetical protein